jgi:hypothetical protein
MEKYAAFQGDFDNIFTRLSPWRAEIQDALTDASKLDVPIRIVRFSDWAQRQQLSDDELSEIKEFWINKTVAKYSGRKFKSGKKSATVKDVIVHPIIKIPALTFLEDDTYVECRKCYQEDKIPIGKFFND